MLKSKERIATILVDFLGINVAYILFYMVRLHRDEAIALADIPLLISATTTFFYWFIVFAFFGLYRLWYEQSRIDEILTIFRATVSGVLILFFHQCSGISSTASRNSFSILYSRILGYSRCVCDNRTPDASFCTAAIVACGDWSEKYVDCRVVGKSIRIMRYGAE